MSSLQWSGETFNKVTIQGEATPVEPSLISRQRGPLYWINLRAQTRKERTLGLQILHLQAPGAIRGVVVVAILMMIPMAEAHLTDGTCEEEGSLLSTIMTAWFRQREQRSGLRVLGLHDPQQRRAGTWSGHKHRLAVLL